MGERAARARRRAAGQLSRVVDAISRGGPTYDPLCVRDVVELGAAGRTEPEIAKVLGITRRMLTRWRRAHPEFDLAMEFAHDLALTHWLGVLEEGVHDRNFNERAFKQFMATKFPDDYRAEPPQRVDVRGLLARIDVDKLSDEVLVALSEDPMSALLNLMAAGELPQLVLPAPKPGKPAP